MIFIYAVAGVAKGCGWGRADCDQAAIGPVTKLSASGLGEFERDGGRVSVRQKPAAANRGGHH